MGKLKLKPTNGCYNLLAMQGGKYMVRHERAVELGALIDQMTLENHRTLVFKPLKGDLAPLLLDVDLRYR